MHRQNLRGAAIVCLVTLLAGGCAAPVGELAPSAETAQRSAYPDWVRIAPAPTDEASYYVGVAGLARTVEDAIEAAEVDAFEQMTEVERRRFILLFDSAAKDGGIETTSDERLELRTNITDEIVGRLKPATELVDTYYRHCPSEDGEDRAAVCEAFALVRFDNAVRDSIFAKTAAAIGKRKQEAGETNMAALIDWTLRNQ